MGELKPNGQRAKRAILWTWIVLAADMLDGTSSYMSYCLLQAVSNGVDVPDAVINADNTRETIVGIFSFLIHIISIITFIMWFRRAYYNLHQSVSHRLAHSEGWAAGCWFVPILNLYRPYKIMKELYQETKAFLSQRGMDMNLSLTTHLLGWWWALWIIGGIFDLITTQMTLRAETLDEMMTSSIMFMVSCAMTVPLAFITVKIIKDYSKAETLLADVQGLNTENQCSAGTVC